MTTTHPGPSVRGDRTPANDPLVTAGLTAGSVLGLTWLAQGLVRDGYDFTRHPMSLLALGDGGWVQIANFVATGGLMLACAAGLRRTMTGGPGARWAPRLVAAIGVGKATSAIAFPVRIVVASVLQLGFVGLAARRLGR